MTHTQAVLRAAVHQRTRWSPEDRERTITGFLNEIHQVLNPAVLEHLADSDPDKLKSMFYDWARFREKRSEQQRVALLTVSVATSATPVPFALAGSTGDKDLSEPDSMRGNVVSLRSAR